MNVEYPTKAILMQIRAGDSRLATASIESRDRIGQTKVSVLQIPEWSVCILQVWDVLSTIVQSQGVQYTCIYVK